MSSVAIPVARSIPKFLGFVDTRDPATAIGASSVKTQRAAETEGRTLLWHKIVCRHAPGSISHGREKGTASGAQAVEATLLSGVSQWVYVSRQSTSFAEYSFGIGGKEIWLNGKLNIGIDVQETPGGDGGAGPLGEGGAGGEAPVWSGGSRDF